MRRAAFWSRQAAAVVAWAACAGAVLLAGPAVHAFASPALSSPPWHAAPPAVPQSPNGSLRGIACPRPTLCFAVGSTYGSGGPSAPLIEKWDGSGWAVQPAPIPDSRNGSELDAISCSSALACTAVGSEWNGTAAPMAETWNGTSWRTVAVPDPTGGNAFLDGVSCTAAGRCMAVGYFEFLTEFAVPFSELRTGSSWTLQVLPPGGVFLSVSCTDATGSCEAVGYQGDPSSPVGPPLAEHWDGSTWSAQVVPAPSGASSSRLNSVSCATALACVGVGRLVDSAGVSRPLAESWNGATWTIQTAPHLGPKGSEFASVWCVSTLACSAVGTAGERPLFAAWDGDGWQATLLRRAVPAASSPLASVACSAWAQCEAVGASTYPSGKSDLLAIGRERDGWDVQFAPEPTGAVASGLSAVTCIDPTECVAAGRVADRPLLQLWNGAGWQILPASVDPAFRSSALVGVACPDAAACVAVGSYVSHAGVLQPFAEMSSGDEWIGQKPPMPAGAVSGSLSGVACPSATFCAAAGTASDGAHEQAFVDAWNGSTWAVLAPPAQGIPDSSLAAISCAATTSCMAVGSYTNGTPLAESWNGTAWTVDSPPNVIQTGGLSSVSCPAANACMAVGGNLSLSWDGRSWVVDGIPGSPEMLATWTGVSCPNRNHCTAVGSESARESPLRFAAEATWNGATWSTATQLLPGSADVGGLAGVACAGPGTCLAVGSHGTSLPAFDAGVPFAVLRR